MHAGGQRFDPVRLHMETLSDIALVALVITVLLFILRIFFQAVEEVVLKLYEWIEFLVEYLIHKFRRK